MADIATLRAQSQERLDQIRNDRNNGASALARSGATLLADLADAGLNGTVPIEEARELVRETCRALSTIRPAMAPMVALAARVAPAAFEVNDSTTALRRTIAIIGASFPNASVIRAITQALHEVWLAPARVVTLSYSGTVQESLLTLSDDIATITVLESEPGGEGERTAREVSNGLQARGWAGSVKLLPDAAMGHALHDANACIVGADAILGRGAFVNKIGTLALAYTALALGVPFFIVSESAKIAPLSWQWQTEQIPFTPQFAPEFANACPAFESVPLAAGQIMSEIGILTRERVGEIAAEIDRGYRLLVNLPA